MRGCACSHCGAKPKGKMKPPGMATASCAVCGRSLIVKMSETETTVTARAVVKRKAAG